ncbi:hypothetical protein FGB62_255g015 [Gracilaria domingensis]|nr:hypothetical protein FGB62_255g015 [Gracilaria domingensis]
MSAGKCGENTDTVYRGKSGSEVMGRQVRWEASWATRRALIDRSKSGSKNQGNIRGQDVQRKSGGGDNGKSSYKACNNSGNESGSQATAGVAARAAEGRRREGGRNEQKEVWRKRAAGSKCGGEALRPASAAVGKGWGKVRQESAANAAASAAATGGGQCGGKTQWPV